MNNNFPWKKIGSYLSGECSADERRKIEAWIESDPQRKKMVEELREIWVMAGSKQQWDTDKAWNKILGRLEKEGSVGHSRSSLRLVESVQEELEMQRTHRGSRRSKWSWSRLHSAVAALVFLVVAMFSIYQYTQHETEVVDESASAMEEVVTDRGQRSQFRLNDGTRVWLNGESRLTIPGEFNTNRRVVKLEGEAFFSVQPDSGRPFIIEAGNSVTKVLGTKFNVHAYSDEDIEVVVEEGKVAFGDNLNNIDQAPQLNQNQMGILSSSGQQQVHEITDLDQYLGWRKGQLVFKDTPFKTVMAKLERWFDIECTVMDSSLEERTVTASFKDESMTEVLNIIALSLGIEYKKQNRAVIFNPSQLRVEG